MALVLAALVCLASGLLLVCLGWSRKGGLPSDLLLRASLAVGFGLGVFSVIFFLARLSKVTNLAAIDLVVIGVLTAAAVLVGKPSRALPGLTGSETRSHTYPAWFHQAVRAAFVIALCSALYSALLRMRAYPHGDGWDAFAIWNLHARFLFLGGPHWRDGFTLVIPWSHPDYPLLLPAAIAHFWTYLGRDDPRVPALIGLFFTFATVGVLFSALSIVRGRPQAMLGAVALLATPSFVEQGAWQYTDIPLSFFYLSTIVLLCLHDQTKDASSRPPAGLLALAGVAAGFAAWTKNEGVLFLGAIIFARQMTFFRDSSRASPQGAKIAFWRRSGLLLAGSTPLLLLIIYFKHWIAPPGDLFSDPSSMVHRVLNLARYWAIIQWYIKGFFRFGDWLLIPGSLLLVVLHFVAGKDDRRAAQPGVRTSVLALALTLAGYFAVYLITPYDLYWHLRFSLSRLFLQLWPAAVFLFFLTAHGLPGDLRSEG
jgi:Dolichyl-phosphate-mannose-protein mannosyltransferase